MKKLYFLFILSFLFTLPLSAQNKLNPIDYTVRINAEASKSGNPTIKLTWESNEYVERYTVRRKFAGDTKFPQFYLSIIDAPAKFYLDKDVQVGEIYEYEITGVSQEELNINKGGLQIDRLVSYGYTMAGYDAPAYNEPGRVLLLVDETMQMALEKEIDQLVEDLEKENWVVVKSVVDRTEKFDKDAVKKIKTLIRDEYNKKMHPSLTTVFILGRVAVPYSGNINPDAHENHKGAWPADAYYGDMDEIIWRDQQIDNTTAARAELHNVPGDGKFDLSVLQNQELAVGRVDFYDMPAFSDDEYELMRKYLNKNHLYRSGQVDVELRGLVDDNFKGNYEGFSASGWRNYSALVGMENVTELDFFETLGTDSYLFSYGCGGGSYTSCNGVGKTDDFATKPVNSVFTLLFGSYFGDWDVKNSFLRAPLASEPMALTCGWAGRPQWYLHHMAFGRPIGYSAMVSQVNKEYFNAVVFNAGNPQGANIVHGSNGTHIALMGDPTVTLNHIMAYAEEPAGDFIVSEMEDGTISLEWEAPDTEDASKYRYNLYRKTADGSDYERVNYKPITKTEYHDDFLYDGQIDYRLHSVKTVTTNNGTIIYESRGVMAEIITVGINDSDLETMAEVYPNPATSYAEIKFTSSIANNARVEIMDIRGGAVKTFELGDIASGSHFVKWNLKDNASQDVAPGVYFIMISTGEQKQIKKVIVNR